MALAMVSENRDVNVIQNELFTDHGNELYLMPPYKYLRCKSASFFNAWILEIHLRGCLEQMLLVVRWSACCTDAVTNAHHAHSCISNA